MGIKQAIGSLTALVFTVTTLVSPALGAGPPGAGKVAPRAAEAGKKVEMPKELPVPREKVAAAVKKLKDLRQGKAIKVPKFKKRMSPMARGRMLRRLDRSVSKLKAAKNVPGHIQDSVKVWESLTKPQKESLLEPGLAVDPTVATAWAGLTIAVVALVYQVTHDVDWWTGEDDGEQADAEEKSAVGGDDEGGDTGDGGDTGAIGKANDKEGGEGGGECGDVEELKTLDF